MSEWIFVLKFYEYSNIFEYSNSIYILTHSQTNIWIHSYNQIWHKRMSKYIHIKTDYTNECSNKYLWQTYSKIWIYSSNSFIDKKRNDGNKQYVGIRLCDCVSLLLCFNRAHDKLSCNYLELPIGRSFELQSQVLKWGPVLFDQVWFEQSFNCMQIKALGWLCFDVGHNSRLIFYMQSPQSEPDHWKCIGYTALR